jgi:argonaute-like protein implicated in RNA metabolism and viral defense
VIGNFVELKKKYTFRGKKSHRTEILNRARKNMFLGVKMVTPKREFKPKNQYGGHPAVI